MAVPKEIVELMIQLADDIEWWIINEPEEIFPDFKFLSDIQFYAGNKKAAVQQLSRIDRILLSLQEHNQGWADALKEKVEDLKAALDSVNKLVVDWGRNRRQCVHTLETPVLRLAQTLREIAKMARKERKRRIVKGIFYVITAFVAFLVALLGIFSYLGWLGPIRTFINNILWPK